MTTTHVSTLVVSSTAKQAAPVQSHRLLSGVLVSIGLAIAAVLSVTFGWLGLCVSFFSLTLPFFLLWLSADVVREDERRR